MNDNFEELYESVILDHSRRPRNYGLIPDATATASGDNPTCGDEITLSLRLDGDRLAGVGFTGDSCAICKASASMMTVKIKGKSRAEAEEMLAAFQDMITGKAAEPAKALGELRLLAGVQKFPQRVKCATLGWHALKAALADDGGTAKNFSVNGNEAGF